MSKMKKLHLTEVVPQLNTRGVMGRVFVPIGCPRKMKLRVTGSVFMCCNRAFLTPASYQSHKDSGTCGKVTYQSSTTPSSSTPIADSSNNKSCQSEAHSTSRARNDDASFMNAMERLFHSPPKDGGDDYSSRPRIYQGRSATPVQQILRSLSPDAKWSSSHKKIDHPNRSSSSETLGGNKESDFDMVDIMSLFKTTKADDGRCTFSCRKCIFQTYDMAKISHHIKKVHSSFLNAGEKINLIDHSNGKRQQVNLSEPRDKVGFQRVRYKASRGSHDTRTGYKCADCSLITSSKILIMKHRSAAHVPGGKFPCDHCSCVFNVQARYKTHFKRMHERKDLHRKSPTGTTADCLSSSADSETLESWKSEDADHWNETIEQEQSVYHKSDDDENLFRCDICQKKFNDKSRLALHQHKIHLIKPTGKQEELLKDCKVMLNAASSRTQCRICFRKFSKSSELVDHNMSAHVEGGKYPCPITGCKCIFAAKKSLQSHLSWHKRHTKTSPDLLPAEPKLIQSTNCELCGIVLKAPKDLAIHLKNSHVVCGVQCSCGCSFATATELTAHKLKDCPSSLERDVKVENVTTEEDASTNSAVAATPSFKSRRSISLCSCGLEFSSRVEFLEHKQKSCVTQAEKMESGIEDSITVITEKSKMDSSHDEGIVCSLCNSKVKNEKGLKVHMFFHRIKTRGSFKKCEACNYPTGNLRNYQLHKKSAHVKGGIKCSECPCAFSGIERLIRHFKRLHKEKIFDRDEYKLRCNDCDFFTFVQSELRRHEKAGHSQGTGTDENGKPDLACHLCTYKATSAQHLKQHLSTCHVDGGFKCESCACSFATEMGRRTHLFQSHKKDIGFFINTCEICGVATGSYKNHKRHMAKLHVDNGFRCPYCPCSLKDAIPLHHHVMIRHKDKEKINLNDYKHKCSTCDYTTYIRGNLKLHEASHLKAEGNSPTTTGNSREEVLCTLCGCKTSQLQDHLARAHVEGGHACSRCCCSFQSEIGLTRHLKIRHGIKVGKKPVTYDSSVYLLPCSKCSFRSKTWQGLNSHSVKMHGIPLPKSPSISRRKTCTLCQMSFTGTTADHTKRYHVPNGFKCSSCCCSFETFGSRFRHMIKVHKISNRKQCSLCGLKFIGTIKKHVKTCHVDEGIPCSFCSCSFKSEQAKTAHTIRIHKGMVPGDKQPKQCELCKVILNESLTNHMNRCHVDGGLTCDQCICTFGSEKSLSIHRSRQHGMSFPVGGPRKKKCELCSLLFFGLRSAHINRCHVPDGLKCDHCSCTFSNHYGKNSHMKKKHGVTVAAAKMCQTCGTKVRSMPDHLKYFHVENGYKCEYCPCSFRTEVSKRRHMAKRHNVEYTIEKNCNLCGMKLYVPLHEHMKSHHSSRGYQCSFCNCKLRTKNGRTKHIAKMHKNCTFEEDSRFEPSDACRLCGMEVQEPLEDHIRRCHCVTNTFTCSSCNCRFRTKNGLTTHFLKQHKIIVDKTSSPGKNQGSRNQSIYSQSSPMKDCIQEPRNGVGAEPKVTSENGSITSQKRLCPSDVMNEFNNTHYENDYLTPTFQLHNDIGVDGNGISADITPKQHLEREKLICPHCGYEASCVSFLNIHIQKSHVRNSLYPCTLCSCAYASESELIRHTTIFHA